MNTRRIPLTESAAIGGAGLLSAAVLGALVGALGGAAGYTARYAEATSYLSDDPASCINCHIMNEQYDGWHKSSHRSVAVCNDCHTPPGFVGKYYTKGLNGFWHSFYFTTGGYPDNIHITERNRAVTEQACRKCHDTMVESIEGHGAHYGGAGEVSCIRCHSRVGHDS